MIEAPSFSSGSAFCTVKNNPLTLVLASKAKRSKGESCHTAPRAAPLVDGISPKLRLAR